mgnify:CR=1 FL=1
MCSDRATQVFSGFFIRGLFELVSEVEVVPTDDAVFDETVAGLGDLLFLFFGLGELAGIANGDGAGEAVGEFDLVELTAI